MQRAWVVAVVLGLPSVALAQAPGQYAAPPPSYPPPAWTPPAPEGHRTGWLIGFGIGAGQIEASVDGAGESEEYGGIGFEFHVGGMLSPNFALMLDAWTIMHHDDNDELDLAQDVVAIAAQYWVSPELWVKGGLGRAQYHVHYTYTIQDGTDTIESDEVPAWLLAVGYELSHSRTFAIDAQLRFSAAAYENDPGSGGATVDLTNGGLFLGFNWY